MVSADKAARDLLLGASRRSHSLRSAAILTAIALVGLGLRLFRLDYNSYWHDEVISTFLARVPAAEIYRSILASDSHPPLYHILLHAWGAAFGYELVPLRLFSVVTSLLCVPLTYALGRALLGRATGLGAAALMAVAPFQIFHGQQARMYPLLTLLVLLSLLALWEAWARGGIWRWGLFGLVAAAGLYTHVYYAFSLLGLNLWACYESMRLRRLERERWAGLILAQLGAVALFLPFVPSMLALTGSVVANFWIRGATPLSWVFALVAILNNSMALNGRAPVWQLLLVYLPAAGAIVLGFVYAVRALTRRPEERGAWALLLFAVLTPCLVATALSLAVRPILLDRSLIGVSGPFYVLFAGAAVRTWRSPVTPLLTAAVAASLVAGLLAVYPAAPRPHSLQSSIDTIFAERRPGDAVILLDWQSFDLTALRYPGAPDVYVGGPAEEIGYWQRRMALMRWHTPDQVGPAEGYAGRYRRVWVLLTPYVYPAAWEAVGPWLRAHGVEVLRREVDEGQVVLYEVAP